MGESTGNWSGKPLAPPQAARTETSLTVNTSTEAEEVTKRLTSPGISAAIQELLLHLQAELSAIEASGGDPVATSDMHVRLALLARDTEDDVHTVLDHCEQAGEHPLALDILRSLAHGASDAQTYEKISSVLEMRGRELKEPAFAAIQSDLADGWLYRFAGPDRALEYAEQAIETLKGEANFAAQNTYAISLAMLEDWAGLESFHAAADDPANAAAAAQLASDRLQDTDRALELAGTLHTQGGELALYGSSLETQLHFLAGADPQVLSEALKRRVTVLEAQAASSAELSATRYSLAEAQEQAGEIESAQATFADLTSKTGWSTSIAQLSALRVATKRRDWQGVVNQLGKLATLAKEEPLATSYGRRRAEVLEHLLGKKIDALKAWQKLFGSIPTDIALGRHVQRLLMDSPLELVAQLEQLAQANRRQEAEFLRKAAAVAETRLGDLATAAGLARRAADSSKLSSDFHEIARICSRQGKSHSVAKVYAEIANVEVDERVAGPLLLMGGLFELVAGREQESIALLAEAAQRAPRDLAIHLLAANVHRSNSNAEALRSALGSISELARSPDTRFEAYSELGQLCRTLNDLKGAASALASASELRPQDTTLLLALAELYDGTRDWDKTVALREQAVQVMPDGPEAARVLSEIGRIERVERKNAKAALRAYERARVLAPGDLETLRQCQELYGELKDPKQQLAMFRSELEYVEEKGRRLTLYLDIARVSQLAGEGTDAAIAALQSALEIDANNSTALKGVLDVAKKLGRHQLIADAYANARETAANVAILSEAYRELKNWDAFVAVRKRHIALLANKGAKAAAALEIAEISETLLHSAEKAVEAYRLALEFEPANRKSQAALRRLLEHGKQWKELVAAIEAELRTLASDASTAKERVAGYCQIAQVQRDQLGRESEAAQAYESVLRIEADNKTALDGLEKLYASLGRTPDLLRIKEAKQATAGEALLQEIAELRQRTGDIDGAVRAYQGALAADPSNREIFTAMEKLCYGKERWNDVIALYNDVIALVEKGETRAYRLGDLYARRGQVQRQFLKDPTMAAASFLRVIEVDPSDDTAMEALSQIFSESSKWTSLIAAYEKRAELGSAKDLKVDSLRNAADIARSKLSDRNETARLFKLLTALSPDDASANESLEEFYTETQNWPELVLILEGQLDRASTTGDVDPALLQRLAKISEEGLRDETRAIRYYERLIELAPQNRRALDALARIFESTERWTEFVEVTRRLVKVTKDRNVKGLLYFKCGSVTEAKFGNEEDAIRYYDAAIKTSPACLPAVHGLRDLYLRRKDWPRIIQTLELEVKLWQDDKERAGVFAQIGRIYGEELIQNDRAMHYYECALAVDPECLPANRALFEHYFDEKQWERAAPLAQALAPKAMRDGDPMRRSEFYRKRGIVASHTGDPVGAAESMVIALEIQPENIAALESLTHLAAVSPRVYDFPGTFRELEKIYRKRANSQSLMARVNVGQAHIMTRAGNLSAAEKLLKEAIGRNPSDYSIVEALVDLHAGTRNWSAAGEALEGFLGRGGSSVELQVRAMMRQAEIFADGEMNAELAAATLQRVLLIDPNNPEVYYLLAQEYFCLDRFDEARVAIEKVIELSAVPGANLSAQRLARYYYYLGRILERGGELRGAISQYRRAAEYDPGYAPPALALALRSMRAGDQRAAETRLINSAHAAMGQGDKRSAIPLQRGLARILLKGGDREAAIEAYRGILEVDPEGAADRLSLAEIYAETDLHKAIDEVRRVVEGDLRHGPAYRVLAGYYMQAGEPARAARVLTNMQMLGYSEEQDRKMAQSARAITPVQSLQQGLSNELRLTLMANEALGSVVGELFCLCYQQMAAVNPPSSLGDNLIPLPSVEDHALHIAVGDMVRLFGMEPEVYIGENVPGRIIVIGHPRRIIVLDRLVLNEPEACRRFALGWAFEGICAGYATVLHLGEKQRHELGQLLCSLFLVESARSPQTNEFVKTLPAGALDIIRRHGGEFQDFDMEAWMDGMNAVARRAGLVACDDLGAAARMLAVLAGESMGEHSAVLGTVFCGEDLFQFHVSDQYDQLRAALSRVPTGMPG